MEIREFLQLEEASFSKGIATVTVIKPGFNQSKSRYYPADVLRRDHKIFVGKMMENHPTKREASERPEGSLRRWVANLRKVWVEADGRIRGEAVIIEDYFRKKLERLATHGLLNEMGVSIRAVGDAESGEVDGKKTTIVSRFLRGRADFVTYPGAGGVVEMLESIYNDEESADLQRFKIRTQRFVKMGLTEAQAEAAAIDGGPDPRKLKPTRIERFQRMGLTEAESEVAAQGWTLKENQP
jgi:hypothetical protein